MPNLGSDDTPVVADNIRTRVAEIDDTDSPYLTQSENEIHSDTTNGNVTITITSADIPASGEPSRSLTIINTSTNDVVIETEGSETIYPDDVASLTVSTDNAFVTLKLVAGNVYVDRNVSRNKVESTEVVMDQGTLNTDATESNDIPTYQQLSDEGGSSISLSETRPSVGSDGDLWYPPITVPSNMRTNYYSDTDFANLDSSAADIFDTYRSFYIGDSIYTFAEGDDQILSGESTTSGELYIVELDNGGSLLDYGSILGISNSYSQYYDSTNDVFYVAGYVSNYDNLIEINRSDLSATSLTQIDPESSSSYSIYNNIYVDYVYSPESGNLYYLDREQTDYDELLIAWDVETDSFLWEQKLQNGINYAYLPLVRENSTDYVFAAYVGTSDTSDNSRNIFDQSGNSMGMYTYATNGVNLAFAYNNNFYAVSYDNNYIFEEINTNNSQNWNVQIDSDNAGSMAISGDKAAIRTGQNIRQFDIPSSSEDWVTTSQSDSGRYGPPVAEYFTVDNQKYITFGDEIVESSSGQIIADMTETYNNNDIGDVSTGNEAFSTTAVQNQISTTDYVQHSSPYVYRNGAWRTVV